VGKRQQEINDFKPLLIGGVVGGADIRDMVETSRGVVVQKTSDIQDPRRSDMHGHFRSGRVDIDGQHRVRKLFEQGFSEKLHGFFGRNV
jgi:hypothetical protein